MAQVVDAAWAPARDAPEEGRASRPLCLDGTLRLRGMTGTPTNRFVPARHYPPTAFPTARQHPLWITPSSPRSPQTHHQSIAARSLCFPTPRPPSSPPECSMGCRKGRPSQTPHLCAGCSYSQASAWSMVERRADLRHFSALYVSSDEQWRRRREAGEGGLSVLFSLSQSCGSSVQGGGGASLYATRPSPPPPGFER